MSPNFYITVKLLNSMEFLTYKPEEANRIMISVCKFASKTEHSTCHGCSVTAIKYFI